MPILENKIKIRLIKTEFNDKMFWAMFDNESAIEHFYPDYQHWQAQGVEFSIQDSSIQHKYLRNIEIWVEAPQDQLINMGLKGFNK
jgi:pyocin large subunit-like protein